MRDTELADEIIARLNKLIADPAVRKDIQKLIEERVFCSETTLNHPTIQVMAPSRNGLCECGAYGGQCSFCTPSFGVLGLLNGLMEVLPMSHKKAGCGYITAEFTDEGALVRFTRTD